MESEVGEQIESGGAPRVSIIIPARNEARHIETCLRDILAFEQPAGGFEVIVADGRSTDGTAAIVGRVTAGNACVRLVDNPGQIVSCGLNAAIRAARGEIIVRIDAHTEYAPDYLVRCVDALERTGVENVGGPWIARGKTYLQRAIAAAFASPFAVGGARGHAAAYSGYVDTVYLGCWPRAVFDRVGLFDEDLVRNQDDEFNLRVTRAGGKVWQSADIRSWYTPRDSLFHLFKQYSQYGYWKVRVIQKHRIPASIRHMVPGAFVATLLALALIAPISGLGRIALAGLIAVYAAAVALASVITGARTEIRLIPALPAVFACFHIGYGSGFLAGFWDFIVRKRRTGRFVSLSRRG